MMFTATLAVLIATGIVWIDGYIKLRREGMIKLAHALFVVVGVAALFGLEWSQGMLN